MLISILLGSCFRVGIGRSRKLVRLSEHSRIAPACSLLSDLCPSGEARKEGRGEGTMCHHQQHVLSNMLELQRNLKIFITWNLLWLDCVSMMVSRI